MLLKGYQREIMNPACNSSFQSVHCIACLDEDISEALPYLNTVLGGDTYIKDPPSLTLRLHGKLITLHPRKIAVNALKDGAEADSVLEWLKIMINETWENRHSIVPKYDTAAKPRILDIYKLLPKTNCRKCGQPTCMMFSALVVDGIKGEDDCPSLTEKQYAGLRDYLKGYKFETV